MNKNSILIPMLFHIIVLALTGCDTMAVLFHGEKPESPPVTRLVSYNANGASGTVPDSQRVTSGYVIILPQKGNLTYAGNIFAGWNENQNGIGPTYISGTSITVNKDTAFYAQWIDGSTPQYTVTFSANGATGGSAPETQTAYSSTTITLPGQRTLVFSEKEFAGWNTLSDGSGLFYSAGDSFAVTENVTLFAQWVDVLPKDTNTYTVNSIQAFKDAIQSVDESSKGGTYIITITGEYVVNQLTFATNAEKRIVLTGGSSPCVLYNGGTNTMLTVPNRITLVLQNNITLNGNEKYYPAVTVSPGGKLEMNVGAVITGGKYSGVWVNGGSFTMDGGSICNNGAGLDGLNASGGGVRVYNNGTFNLSKGIISDNACDGGGGGVHITDATFNMTGGTISGNSSRDGGGVRITGETSVFNMSNGSIVSNTVHSYDSTDGGGGVAVSDGIFTMSGGTISGNTVTLPSVNTYGGGVFVLGYNGGIFVKNGGGTIDDTNSAQYGKVVFVSNSNLDWARNTTAGPSVNMNSAISGSTGGWE